MLDRNSQEQQNPMKTECGKATKVCVWFVFTFILRREECFTINARPVKCECDWPKTDRCGISRFRTVSFLEWKLNINDIFYQVCHLFQNCIQMKQFKVMCLHLKACHSDQTQQSSVAAALPCIATLFKPSSQGVSTTSGLLQCQEWRTHFTSPLALADAVNLLKE